MADPPRPWARSDPAAGTGATQATTTSASGGSVALTSDPLGRLNAGAPADLVKRAQRARLVGERKPVTAVFADIVGSTSIAEAIDPEDWTLIINGAFDALSRSIFRFEGTIAQVQGDAIISFFGAPVAHEDDPERAVRAALEMIDAISSYGAEVRAGYGIDFQIRIGICTGLVLVGNVGSDLRYDYNAIGDTMNLASRLQGAAPPGGILISDRTERYVRPLFELEDIGALELKGKSDAVQAYRVIGPRARPGPTRGIQGLDSPLVGRAAELERLLGLTSVVRAGRGRWAVIIAEPGLGKSRLLGELRSALEKQEAIDGSSPVAWVAAHASSYEKGTPFHLIRSLVLDILGVSAESAPSEVDAVLRGLLASLAPDDSEAHQYLAALLGSPMDDAEAALVSRTSGDLLQDRIVAAVLRLVKRSAEQGPLVIAIEDLHWADAASIECIQAMLALIDEAPILLVCTSRDEPQSAGWTLINSARDRMGHAITELHLAPLDEERTRELVANLLEIESLPEHTRELILRKAEGNPFFVEEVIRALIERGGIERRDGRWVATTTVAHVEIPDTVHGLILSRIDRQPPDARRVLRLASCIDRQFPLPLLEDVARVAGDGHDLGAALGRLEAANLVVLATTVPELEYRFSHALIQDAAQATVLRQERREWHRRIAEALLARYPERETQLAPRLARHYEEAGDVEQALHHLLVAVRQGMLRNAFVDARSLIARARALVPQLPEPDSETGQRLRLGVTLARIATEFLSLRDEETSALISEARGLAEAVGAPSALADALFWEILMRRAHGERPETHPGLAAALERVGELADGSADEVQQVMVLFQTGFILWWSGDFHSSLESLRQAASLMEKLGDIVGAAMAQGYMAVNHASRGDFEQADERMRVARRYADQADELSRLDYQLAEAVIASERGDYGKSRRFAGDCFAGASKMGALGCATAAAVMLGAAQMGIGDADEARTSLEKSLELAAQGYLAPIRLRASVFLASVAGMSGDLASAEQGFQMVLGDLASKGNPYGQAEAQLYRGLVLATHPDGEPGEALSILDEALAVFESLGARPSLARTLRARALALQRLGRIDEADAAFAQAAALAEEMGLLDGPWPRNVAELDAARSARPIQPV